MELKASLILLMRLRKEKLFLLQDSSNTLVPYTGGTEFSVLCQPTDRWQFIHGH